MVDHEQEEGGRTFITVGPLQELETGSLGAGMVSVRCHECGFEERYMVIYGDPRWGEDEERAAWTTVELASRVALMIAIAEGWGDIVAGAFNRVNSDNSRGTTLWGVTVDLLCQLDPELGEKFPVRFEP